VKIIRTYPGTVGINSIAELASLVSVIPLMATTSTIKSSRGLGMAEQKSDHRYRKKPVVITARQFETNNETGDKNMNDLCIWMNQGRDQMVAWHNGTYIFIQTLEGEMKAQVGDWIIQGVNGEFYPCRNDIFQKTYEKV
jgi:hypothetical protein